MSAKMEYKTPQTTFTEAINFDNLDKSDKMSVGSSINSLHAKFNNVLRRLNNSEYVYPTISVMIMTLMSTLFIFNHSVSVLMKCVIVLLLLIFIIYTIYQYRYK